ncbi:MAG: hypothetical protein B6244_10460 [Candidatus Cloacimonetes bacterium 4572_55]|nr:MAG: hypothetical protein B6244_10460 [Candidatus Cloacimonetes bacterium 4572_55]
MTHFRIPRASNRKRIKQLNITSLIDIFTILLVFLLKNYSVEGDIVSISPDLNLPAAAVEKKPNRDFMVTVSKAHISAEHVHVVDLNDVDQAGLSIPELKQEMVNHRQKIEKFQETNSSIAFTGKVLIQADEEIPFRTIKQVMFTCGESGYQDISLVLRKRE